MSMQLRIFPCEGITEGTTIELRSSMEFQSDWDLTSQMKGVQIKPLPHGTFLRLLVNERLKKTRHDGWGNDISYTTGRELNKLRPTPYSNAQDKAIMAFIKAMPDEAIFVLYWR